MSTKEQKIEYNAAGLLDAAAAVLKTDNDAQLSRALGVAPPVISKLRHNRMPVGDSMILKIHELAGMPVATIRGFIGGAA